MKTSLLISLISLALTAQASFLEDNSSIGALRACQTCYDPSNYMCEKAIFYTKHIDAGYGAQIYAASESTINSSNTNSDSWRRFKTQLKNTLLTIVNHPSLWNKEKFSTNWQQKFDSIKSFAVVIEHDDMPYMTAYYSSLGQYGCLRHNVLFKNVSWDSLPWEWDLPPEQNAYLIFGFERSNLVGAFGTPIPSI